MSGKPSNLPEPDAPSPWNVFAESPEGLSWAVALLAVRPLLSLRLASSIAEPWGPIAGLLLSAVLVAGAVLRMGLRPARPRWLPALGTLGIAVAAVAGITALQMHLLHLAPGEFLESQSSWRILGAVPAVVRWTAAVLAAPFTEEVLYRGLLQNMAARVVGKIAAIALVALLFAAMHTPFKIAFPPMLAVGILFGILADRHGVATSFAAHALYNACALASATYAIQHAAP